MGQRRRFGRVGPTSVSTLRTDMALRRGKRRQCREETRALPHKFGHHRTYQLRRLSATDRRKASVAVRDVKWLSVEGRQ